MKGKILSLVASAAIISGCSGAFGTMDGIMSSWEGAHIDDVVKQWGYPHQQMNFRGKQIYIWNHNKKLFMPATTKTSATVTGNQVYATSTTTGGHTSTWGCDRILEVDADGVIVDWQWKGNNCPFAEAMEYSTWRNKSPVAAN